MASSTNFPNVFSWIQNLAPISEWTTSSMALCICCSSSSQPSLNLTIAKNPQSPKLFFAILADFNTPVSLWTSKPFKPSHESIKLLDEATISNLLVNFVEAILHYGSNRNSPSVKFPNLDSISNFPDIFNLAFLTLLFLVCIYESPSDLRSGCLTTIKNHLASPDSREASKLLMKLLGSNLEEQLMRSVNLAITNWVVELRATNQLSSCRTPSPLFSCAFSTFGLWKIQVYCPVIVMDVENSNSHPSDERLRFSLRYHQLEGVLQFNYKVTIKEKWVDIIVNIDNIR